MSSSPLEVEVGTTSDITSGAGKLDQKAKRARKGRALIEREEGIRKARMSEASTKVVGMLFMERGRGRGFEGKGKGACSCSCSCLGFDA